MFYTLKYLDDPISCKGQSDYYSPSPLSSIPNSFLFYKCICEVYVQTFSLISSTNVG